MLNLAPILLVRLQFLVRRVARFLRWSSQWRCGSVGWGQLWSLSALGRTVSNAGLTAYIYLSLENLWEQHLWEAPNQLADVCGFFFFWCPEPFKPLPCGCCTCFVVSKSREEFASIGFAMVLHFQLLLVYLWTTTSLSDWTNPAPSHDFQTSLSRLQATWWPFPGSPIPFLLGRFEIELST